MIKAVATYGLRQHDKDIVKATWNDDTPTGEELIQSLIDYSSRSARHGLAGAIRQRITPQSPWKVVLKALSLVHRLIRDGDESFLQDALHCHRMLALDNYCDSSTQEGVEQSSFIGQYARFLSQKLDMYNELNYVLERRFKDNSSSAMEWIGSLPLTEIQRTFGLVFTAMERLMDCEVYVMYDDIHPIARKTLVMLLKDSLRFYSFLTISIFQLIDQVNTFDNLVCAWMSEQLDRFSKLNVRYKSWSHKLCALKLINETFLPNFDTIPAGVIANVKTLLSAKAHERRTSSKPEKDRSRSASRTPKTTTASEQIAFVVPPSPTSTRTRKSKGQQQQGQPTPHKHEVDLLGLDSMFQSAAQLAPSNAQPNGISNPFQLDDRKTQPYYTGDFNDFNQ
ncbi:ENTH domain-containing protein [Plasmodiophora brassicae]